MQPALTFEEWLRELGLEQNPFAVTAADQEREQLKEAMFIPVAEYDRIYNEPNILVLAPRGGGKSSLRVRLASLGLPYDFRSSTLYVEYTDFTWLLRCYESNKRVTHEDHIYSLLNFACEALFDCFFSTINLTTESTLQLNVERIQGLSEADKSSFGTFLYHYAPHLLSVGTVHRVLSVLGNATLTRKEVENNIADKEFELLLKYAKLPEHPVAQFLLDLIGAIREQVKPTLSPQVTKHVTSFLELLTHFEIYQVRILIDRVDGILELAKDVKIQIALLEPLLAFKQLFEIPNLGFKFFLGSDLYDALRQSLITKDHELFTNRLVRIEWSSELLMQLLDTRLAFFSNREIQSLKQLCDVEKSEGLEKNLVDFAQGSPRRLLRATEAVFWTCYRSDPQTLISLDDWEKAKPQLLRDMPPVLRISRYRGGVDNPSGFNKFTKLEYEIMSVLIEEGGFCEREELVQRVPTWDGVCAPRAMEKAIGRLRKKLGDFEQEPVYLRTIHNRGYELQYFEIVD